MPHYSPADWIVDETGGLHEIEIPENASITIDYDAINYGDYIAVADSDGNIGGMIMWNGQFEVLSAWGSSFAPGEIFNWYI